MADFFGERFSAKLIVCYLDNGGQHSSIVFRVFGIEYAGENRVVDEVYAKTQTLNETDEPGIKLSTGFIFVRICNAQRVFP
ncbi:MAG: hypothetical protein II661_08795, partial [Bacteroidales bacterium]|nr:hypothetical protein [Bacteroidales bacterium]